MKGNIFKIRKILINMFKIKKIIREELYLNFFENKNIISREIGIETKIKRETKIIVSLTTYNKRIMDVYLTIESIFFQTLRADKVVLWLDEEEFTDKDIPLRLQFLKERGLEIKYCINIKSYKKIIPSLKEYPNDIIITIDDDVIYPSDLIENLYKTHLKFKKDIIYYRGKEIIFDKLKNPKEYSKWKDTMSEKNSKQEVLPTGVGGVLYPPKSLNLEVLKQEKFMKLAPTADDIWLKAMSLKQNTYSRMVEDKRGFDNLRFKNIEASQDIALSIINVKNKNNDIQLKKVFNEYKLWKKLRCI